MSVLEIATVDFDRIVANALNVRVKSFLSAERTFSFTKSMDRRRVERILLAKEPVKLHEIVNLSRIFDFSVPTLFSEIEAKVDEYQGTGVNVKFSAPNYSRSFILYFLSGLFCGLLAFVGLYSCTSIT